MHPRALSRLCLFINAAKGSNAELYYPKSAVKPLSFILRTTLLIIQFPFEVGAHHLTSSNAF
jgi:hypothetical protein